MKSFYQWSGIPDALSVGLAALAFIVALSPYIGGTNFGLFNVPQFSERARLVLRWIGPPVLVITILGFFPLIPTESPQLPKEIPTPAIISWSKITDDTVLTSELDGAFRVYLELYSGIEKDDNGVPRCYRYLGVSRVSNANESEVKLRINPKTRDEGTPNLVAFIVRERDGYYKLLDTDPITGMPKNTRKTRNEKIWSITNYSKGELVKIVLFVIPDANQPMAAYNFLGAEDIVNVQFEKN